MPDKRRHRGAAPEDRRLFAPSMVPVLAEATADLSWLLTRGYAERSALKLVGDRLQLAARQRTAVMRCACSDQSLAGRRKRKIDARGLAGEKKSVLIDGYNVLIAVESALAGGVLLLGRDRCMRDMASMHGSYRKVDETRPALSLIGRQLENSGVIEAVWYLDQPVSNSGRLKTIMVEIAQQNGWRWDVPLVPNPDVELIDAGDEAIVCSADSVVLDRCGRWFNLAPAVVANHVPDAWMIDLGKA